MTCIVCGAASLTEIDPYHALFRITSDCRPFRRGGRLYHCEHCGAVQKQNDDRWQEDCKEIYDAYDVYSVSAGIEQSVRGGSDGSSFGKRSDLILACLRGHFELPPTGRFLDFGCGSGVSSKAASEQLFGWTLDGFDLDRRMEKGLKIIDGFETLYDGDPEEIPERYDVIMLTHVLEHVPNPKSTLQLLAGLLKPDGKIVVQVPNRVANPFDLLVADHLIHFDEVSLARVCHKAGLCLEYLASDWVAKELTLVISTPNLGDKAVKPSPALTDPPQAHVKWLTKVAEFCRDHKESESLGLFGTSLISVWMGEELGRQPDFYLDEDPAKIGKTLHGVTILAPKDAPEGATVIPAMAPAIVRLVSRRYQDAQFTVLDLPEAEITQNR